MKNNGAGHHDRFIHVVGCLFEKLRNVTLTAPFASKLTFSSCRQIGDGGIKNFLHLAQWNDSSLYMFC